jgi:hypothetical protein
LTLYNGFNFATPEAQLTVAEIIRAFDDYAVGESNVTYERFLFHKRIQSDSESVDDYIAALRNLIKTCEFCENCKDSVLRDQIVLGVWDVELQDDLLKVRNIALTDCITRCKLAENAAKHSKEVRPEPVHKVNVRQSFPKQRKRSKDRDDRKSRESDDKSAKSCKFCTSRHEMKRELCPAYGQTCSKCKGKNHFAARCKASKRRVNALNENSSSESDSSEFEPVDAVSTTNDATVCSVASKLIKAKMLIAKDRKPVVFQLDSGASVNLLSVDYVDRDEIKSSSKTLVMWNGTKLKPLGESRVRIINSRNGDKFAVNFVIVEGKLQPLLGATAIQKMNLITVNKEQFVAVAPVTPEATPVTGDCDVIQEFNDVFKDELGSLPGVVKLKVDLLLRCRERGIRLNPDKLKLCQKS